MHAAEAVSSPLSIVSLTHCTLGERERFSVSLGDVGDDSGVTDRVTTYIHIQTLGTSRERDF